MQTNFGYLQEYLGIATLDEWLDGTSGASHIPASGSNTQVQYNASGSLAGSANFIYDSSTTTVRTGKVGPLAANQDFQLLGNGYDGNVLVYGGNTADAGQSTGKVQVASGLHSDSNCQGGQISADPASSATSGPVLVETGDFDTDCTGSRLSLLGNTNTSSGAATLSGTDHTVGNGGDLTITGGLTGGPTGTRGGNVTIQGGANLVGTGDGGDCNVLGGYGPNGGPISLTAGDGGAGTGGDGGDITITAGASSVDAGGSVTVACGSPASSFNFVQLWANSGGIGTPGNIIFDQGGVQLKWTQGTGGNNTVCKIVSGGGTSSAQLGFGEVAASTSVTGSLQYADATPTLDADSTLLIDRVSANDRRLCVGQAGVTTTPALKTGSDNFAIDIINNANTTDNAYLNLGCDATSGVSAVNLFDASTEVASMSLDAATNGLSLTADSIALVSNGVSISWPDAAVAGADEGGFRIASGGGTTSAVLEMTPAVPSYSNFSTSADGIIPAPVAAENRSLLMGNASFRFADPDTIFKACGTQQKVMNGQIGIGTWTTQQDGSTGPSVVNFANEYFLRMTTNATNQRNRVYFTLGSSYSAYEIRISLRTNYFAGTSGGEGIWFFASDGTAPTSGDTESSPNGESVYFDGSNGGTFTHAVTVYNQGVSAGTVAMGTSFGEAEYREIRIQRNGSGLLVEMGAQGHPNPSFTYEFSIAGAPSCNIFGIGARSSATRAGFTQVAYYELRTYPTGTPITSWFDPV